MKIKKMRIKLPDKTSVSFTHQELFPLDFETYDSEKMDPIIEALRIGIVPEVVDTKVPMSVVKKIVTYLNKMAERNYKFSESVRSLINTRMNEGFTEDDFYKCIDIKVHEWKDNPQMVDYLRPVTLFGNKMNNYINQTVTSNGTKGINKTTQDSGRIKTFEGDKGLGTDPVSELFGQRTD